MRGVSVASEDRLRRWARTWLADAAAAAESLMAGNLRGRAGSGGAAAATPRSRRAAASANASSDVDSASDSDAGEPTETSETSESSRRRFAFLPAGGVDAALRRDPFLMLQYTSCGGSHCSCGGTRERST